jgi:hypothetical protein
MEQNHKKSVIQDYQNIIGQDHQRSVKQVTFSFIEEVHKGWHDYIETHNLNIMDFPLEDFVCTVHYSKIKNKYINLVLRGK